MHTFRRGIFKSAISDTIESFVDRDIEEIIKRNHGIELGDASWCLTKNIHTADFIVNRSDGQRAGATITTIPRE